MRKANAKVCDTDVSYMDMAALFSARCRNEDIREVVFDLYIIYFDKDKKIIYVGTTTKNPPTEILNKCFEDAEPINGENTFKCLYNIQRLKLSTLGLNANNSGYVSYRMYAGRDVIEGISDPNKLNSYKNNLFGKGYENQDETSMGCSKKGKTIGGTILGAFIGVFVFIKNIIKK